MGLPKNQAHGLFPILRVCSVISVAGLFGVCRQDRWRLV